MTREQLNPAQQYLVDEYVSDYQSGEMSRRDMVRRVLHITGGVASTATLLLSMGCAPAVPTATATTAPTAVPTATPKPTAAPTTAPAAAATTAPAAAAAAATTAPKPTAGASPAAGAAPTATAGPRSPLSVRADDPDVVGEDVTFPGGDATLMGYLVRPKGNGPFAVVLVCSENRGLNEHIRDVTRRLAKAGYVGLAVDLLSRDGGTAKVDPAQIGAKLSANPARNVADFQAGLRHLQSLPTVQKANVGMTGFCFGGGVTWEVAVATLELKAAVPFYGSVPKTEDVPKIRAAVLGIYGETDNRINAGIPPIEAAMKANNKIFEKEIYPGAGHGFNNDTGNAYNQPASNAAWQRALDWFKKHLV